MTVVLTILGIIGKVLLAVLLILLVIAVLILFVPITYRVTFRKNEEQLAVQASAAWLFRFVQARFSMEKHGESPQTEMGVRIAGIPLRLSGGQKKKAKNKKEAEEGSGRKVRTEAAKKPTVQPGQRKQPSETQRSLPVEVVPARHPGVLIRLGARIAALFGRLKRLYRKLQSGHDILAEWLDYFGSESFGRAREVLFREGGAILRHVLPRHLHGYVRFGTDDPAKTGMLLGIFALFYPTIPETFSVEPDFTESVLEADAAVRGHIMLIVLLVRAVRILLSKDVRKLIRHVLDKRKAGKEKTNKAHSRRNTTWRKTKKTMHFRTT